MFLRREHFSSDLNKVKECIIEKEPTGWGGRVGPAHGPGRVQVGALAVPIGEHGGSPEALLSPGRRVDVVVGEGV